MSSFIYSLFTSITFHHALMKNYNLLANTHKVVNVKFKYTVEQTEMTTQQSNEYDVVYNSIYKNNPM